MEKINLNELECLPNEIWKLHPVGVAVSNLGRCFVPKSGVNPAHYTYGSDNNEGYMQVGWESKGYKVHRLVAECFIENPNNYPTVDHINRDKTDNRVENLRWATMSMQQYNRGNYKRPNAPNNNAQSKQVVQINPITNEIIRIWESAMEAHRNGFNHGHISNCCLNKRNSHKGYKWQFHSSL